VHYLFFKSKGGLIVVPLCHATLRFQRAWDLAVLITSSYEAVRNFPSMAKSSGNRNTYNVSVRVEDLEHDVFYMSNNSYLESWIVI